MRLCYVHCSCLLSCPTYTIQSVDSTILVNNCIMSSNNQQSTNNPLKTHQLYSSRYSPSQHTSSNLSLTSLPIDNSHTPTTTNSSSSSSNISKSTAIKPKNINVEFQLQRNQFNSAKKKLNKKFNSTCHLCEHSRHKCNSMLSTNYIHCSTVSCSKSYCRRPGCLRKLMIITNIYDINKFNSWYQDVCDGTQQFICCHCTNKSTCIGNGCVHKYKRDALTNDSYVITNQYTTTNVHHPQLYNNNNNTIIAQSTYDSIYHNYNSYPNNMYLPHADMNVTANINIHSSQAISTSGTVLPPGSNVAATLTTQLYEQIGQYLSNAQQLYSTSSIQLYNNANHNDASAPYGWLNSTVPIEKRKSSGLSLPSTEPVTMNAPIYMQLRKALEDEISRRQLLSTLPKSLDIFDPVLYNNSTINNNNTSIQYYHNTNNINQNQATLPHIVSDIN